MTSTLRRTSSVDLPCSIEIDYQFKVAGLLDGGSAGFPLDLAYSAADVSGIATRPLDSIDSAGYMPAASSLPEIESCFAVIRDFAADASSCPGLATLDIDRSHQIVRTGY